MYVSFFFLGGGGGLEKEDYIKKEKGTGHQYRHIDILTDYS